MSFAVAMHHFSLKNFGLLISDQHKKANTDHQVMAILTASGAKRRSVSQAPSKCQDVPRIQHPGDFQHTNMIQLEGKRLGIKTIENKEAGWVT